MLNPLQFRTIKGANLADQTSNSECGPHECDGRSHRGRHAQCGLGCHRGLLRRKLQRPQPVRQVRRRRQDRRGQSCQGRHAGTQVVAFLRGQLGGGIRLTTERPPLTPRWASFSTPASRRGTQVSRAWARPTTRSASMGRAGRRWWTAARPPALVSR